MTELVRYDAMRIAIRDCATVDDTKEVRDKAKALVEYAKQRDDIETQAAFKEIYLRACIRIGEISRELETAQGDRTELHPASRKKSKTDALADAGISTSTAHDYEELAGGREEQAINAAAAATESYFAGTKAKGEVPSMAGLQGAVKGAVIATIGPKPKRERQPGDEPAPPGDPLVGEMIDFKAMLRTIAEKKWNFPGMVARIAPVLVDDDLADAIDAYNAIAEFIEALERRIAA